MSYSSLEALMDGRHGHGRFGGGGAPSSEILPIFLKNATLCDTICTPSSRLAQNARMARQGQGLVEAPMYIIARNISGPRLRCEALMVDKKSFTPWPPVTEDGWRRAYKFRDRLMAEVVRLEIDPLGEELKVIEAVYIR